jgi:hypothetical protein
MRSRVAARWNLPSTTTVKVGLRTIKTTPFDNGYVVIETAAA